MVLEGYQTRGRYTYQTDRKPSKQACWLGFAEGYDFRLSPSTLLLLHAFYEAIFQVGKPVLMVSKCEEQRGVGPKKAGQEGSSGSGQ